MSMVPRVSESILCLQLSDHESNHQWSTKLDKNNSIRNVIIFTWKALLMIVGEMAQ